MAKHANSKKSLTARATSLLESCGLSRTQPRIVLLELFLEHACALSVEELSLKVAKSGFDLATVYRTVKAFDEAGLVSKINLADGLSRYEIKAQDDSHHHHHIVCRSCKKVSVVKECLGKQLNKIATKLGFSQVEHSLEFYGTCQQCSGT